MSLEEDKGEILDAVFSHFTIFFNFFPAQSFHLSAFLTVRNQLRFYSVFRHFRPLSFFSVGYQTCACDCITRYVFWSIGPSNLPWFHPSIRSSVLPSFDPSIRPSAHPSIHPLSHPSIYPTTCPSVNSLKDLSYQITALISCIMDLVSKILKVTLIKTNPIQRFQLPSKLDIMSVCLSLKSQFVQ